VLAERLPVQAANQALPLARVQTSLLNRGQLLLQCLCAACTFARPRRRRPRASASTQHCTVSLDLSHRAGQRLFILFRDRQGLRSGRRRWLLTAQRHRGGTEQSGRSGQWES